MRGRKESPGRVDDDDQGAGRNNDHDNLARSSHADCGAVKGKTRGGQTNGWVPVPRFLLESFLSRRKEPFTRLEALLDLRRRVWWGGEGGIQTVSGREYRVERGGGVVSTRNLAVDWGWSKGRVGTFLVEVSTNGLFRVHQSGCDATHLILGPAWDYDAAVSTDEGTEVSTEAAKSVHEPAPSLGSSPGSPSCSLSSPTSPPSPSAENGGEDARATPLSASRDEEQEEKINAAVAAAEQAELYAFSRQQMRQSCANLVRLGYSLEELRWHFEKAHGDDIKKVEKALHRAATRGGKCGKLAASIENALGEELGAPSPLVRVEETLTVDQLRRICERLGVSSVSALICERPETAAAEYTRAMAEVLAEDGTPESGVRRSDLPAASTPPEPDVAQSDPGTVAAVCAAAFGPPDGSGGDLEGVENSGTEQAAEPDAEPQRVPTVVGARDEAPDCQGGHVPEQIQAVEVETGNGDSTEAEAVRDQAADGPDPSAELVETLVVGDHVGDTDEPVADASDAGQDMPTPAPLDDALTVESAAARAGPVPEDEADPQDPDEPDEGEPLDDDLDDDDPDEDEGDEDEDRERDPRQEQRRDDEGIAEYRLICPEFVTGVGMLALVVGVRRAKWRNLLDQHKHLFERPDAFDAVLQGPYPRAVWTQTPGAFSGLVATVLRDPDVPDEPPENLPLWLDQRLLHYARNEGFTTDAGMLQFVAQELGTARKAAERAAKRRARVKRGRWRTPRSPATERIPRLNLRSTPEEVYRVRDLGRSSSDPAVQRRCAAVLLKYLGDLSLAEAKALRRAKALPLVLPP